MGNNETPIENVTRESLPEFPNLRLLEIPTEGEGQ